MHITTFMSNGIGDKALLPQREFERLVELAQRYEEIIVYMPGDDVSTLDIMRLTEQSDACDFWQEARGRHLFFQHLIFLRQVW